MERAPFDVSENMKVFLFARRFTHESFKNIQPFKCKKLQEFINYYNCPLTC